MPSPVRSNIALRTGATLLVMAWLAGCAAIQPVCPPPPVPTPAPARLDIEPYFQALESVSTRDAAASDAALAGLRTAHESSRLPADTLRYVFALGAGARDDSDPVEARRLLDEMLAGTALEPEQRRLASVLRAEFDARITLVAELARERQLAQRRRDADAGEQSRRIEQLNAENQRLKRELAQARRKLSAIEDIERALSEQAEVPAEPSP